MHRCFIETKNWHKDRIVPTKDEAHHLVHVLRAEDGDRVAVFDGLGREARAIVSFGSGNDIELIIQDIGEASPRAVELTLIVAIPKGSRADLIMEKATELGVARIIPVISERVISRPHGKQAVKKVERWRRVAQAASKQCGTKWLPRIEEIAQFPAIIKTIPEFDAVLLGSLAEGVQPLKAAIANLQSKHLKSIAVIIGPEGDLTGSEIEESIAAGAMPVSFGDLTLRVETAAIYAASILAYEFLWQTSIEV
jgi:16S rRNA (uracil1498-N3)-methyltransferase